MEAFKSGIKRITESRKRIDKEVMEKTTGYILAAFGFVVALAWNDAIKTFIEYLFPLNKDSIFAKFIYAMLITIAIVILTIILTRRNNQEAIKK